MISNFSSMRINRGQLLPVALLACVASSCADAAAERDAKARIQPTYDSANGRLTRLSYDSNRDGKADTWAYMDGSRLIRLEADENEDGRIDRWEYYPATAAVGAGVGAPKQSPERIERATRLDGQVSRREFFEGAQMVRVEEDTDANGATDKWETYSDGALTVLALDTSGKGKADRRLIYRSDGSLDHVEADSHGSGNFQRVKP